MEDTIKDPEFPVIGENEGYSTDDINLFLSNEKDVIKSFLDKVPRIKNRPSFSIESEDICLLNFPESFRVGYKIIRDQMITAAETILKSSNDLTVENIEIPIVTGPARRTCSFKITFKEK